MKRLLLNIAAIIALTACNGGSGEYVVGNLEIFEDFKSQFVESRAVRVWTPSDYDPSIKYDVIYMHDGQNLFDASLTWNNQEWGVDEVLTDLMAKGEIRPCIVVGIDNSPRRYDGGGGSVPRSAARYDGADGALRYARVFHGGQHHDCRRSGQRLRTG